MILGEQMIVKRVLYLIDRVRWGFAEKRESIEVKK
jgi:hypothetical protein